MKVLTIYGHGSHLGHVTWTTYINFLSPFPRRLHMKFGFDEIATVFPIQAYRRPNVTLP